MKFVTHSKKTARGFTLIELVIVIAVIAILAALLVPTILSQAERARLTRARGDTSQLAKTIARMRTDVGASAQVCLTNLNNLTNPALPADCIPEGYTATDIPLCTLKTTSPGQLCWNGPYQTAITNDPWNMAYTVTQDLTTNAITVRSNGPDRGPNTTDDLSYTQ